MKDEDGFVDEQYCVTHVADNFLRTTHADCHFGVFLATDEIKAIRYMKEKCGAQEGG